jgi:hypothetical protein
MIGPDGWLYAVPITILLVGLQEKTAKLRHLILLS